MVLDSVSATQLKPWLIRTLEPICDAEPGALADYILALLQHNVPENEMRQELAVQLDEFLEKECSSFIDTLFTVIRTKSYLPYNAAPASPSSAPKTLDNGIPIPLDVLLQPSSERTRKRSSADDERDGRPPAKGPRLNNDGHFSRYSNGGDGRLGPQSSGGWSRPQMDRFRDGSMGGMGGMGMGMSMGMGGFPGQMVGMGMNGMGMGSMNGRRPQGYQPPDQKRGICRDYHNNGYCARGAMCKYSHGDDAVVPGQLFPTAMPFMSMFPGNGNGMPFMQGAAYDPHEARMDMRPMGGRQHQRAPLLPRIQQEDGSRAVHPINASGELPVIQDLTPMIPPDIPPSEPTSQTDVDMQQSSTPPVNAPQTENGYNPVTVMNGNIPQSADVPMDVVSNNTHMPGMRPPTLGRGQSRGGRGGSNGRGRGTFGGEVHNFRPEKRNDKTLVVEKIPEDKLSLESVNSWFKRFGTVTNVAIDAVNAKALVSFSNHEDAHAAWKSEDAVFGNRFVKVFWHRPMEGHGQVGARMLAASAPLVANMATTSSSTTQLPSAPAPTSTSTLISAAGPTVPTTAIRKSSATPGTSATLSALAAKQQLLEQTITEQKSLMASLEMASAEEKKEIMARLRKLGEEMTKLTSSTPASTSTSSTNAAGKRPVDSSTDHERRERERLDKELDMRNGSDEHGGESAEDLKAKLERLKAEAASLGLDAALPSSLGPYRGYRGRGRGAPRGYFRGATMRGGPPRASMKLDNRPKKLLVKGVREDNSQALRDWYETTGQLESIEPTEGSGVYIVSFRSRSAAEIGLAKGSNIPIVGSVQISWFTGKESTSPTTSSQTTKTLPSEASGATTAVDQDDASFSDTHHHSHMQEEEIIASGWGGDGDDEDGMGLL
ncbi:hypothetical protein GALMADRAFT_131542 [Galerina marginata CBS 339.88]|uniref:C3H1-type domain-containing protein n=1 Tax=Galerina marginata (strain CBS 339.88) TaxID=685588 RepID=A0A067TND5_GALM3|nr:hypothetical protein GALMADRAFT_131542 [Galerina marginata CBS 339.88]